MDINHKEQKEKENTPSIKKLTNTSDRTRPNKINGRNYRCKVSIKIMQTVPSGQNRQKTV